MDQTDIKLPWVKKLAYVFCKKSYSKINQKKPATVQEILYFNSKFANVKMTEPV